MNNTRIPTYVSPISKVKSELLEVLNDFETSVIATFGPLGKTVIISTLEGIVPHVTKDGVTVSESIVYSDTLKNNIAALIKEAARKTSEEVGDGTTTATLLAINLIKESLNSIHSNMRSYLEGIDKAVDYVIECLQEDIKEIEMGSEEMKAVINISSNNDLEITSLLTDITEKIGPHGIIDVKYGEGETNVIISNGAVIESNIVAYPDVNYIYEYNNRTDILLVEGVIEKVNEIKEVLKYAALGDKTPIVIIAQGFSQEVHRVVNINNQNESCKVSLIEAEGFSTSRLQILKDIALITGAEILSTQGATPLDLRTFNSVHLGTVNGIVVNPHQIILYCDKALLESKEVLARKAQLIEEYEGSKITETIVSVGENSVLKRRLSKFVSLATIFVGGRTKAEQQEKRDRMEDAVAAISAAVNGGVLPGGGAALYRAPAILDARKQDFAENAQLLGMTAIINLCAAPILELTGHSLNEDKLTQIYLDNESAYNVITKEIVNAYEVGILDPALVLIKALTNAVAVNRSIMNSSAFITYISE